MTRLLTPGEPEVAVFADASASDDLGIGSWAYSIPTFDVCGAGIDHGGHIERYELAGVVSGIEAAANIDASTRRRDFAPRGTWHAMRGSRAPSL